MIRSATLVLAFCIAGESVGGFIFVAGPFGQSESTILQRADTDGGNLVTLFDSPDAIRGIAIDEANQKIYWTSSPTGTGEVRIRRANLDGGQRETIHVAPVDPSDHARGIAVDGIGGFVYWAESENFRIRRARLNGSEAADFLTGLGNAGTGPYDVDLDLVGGKIYWSEGSGPARIQRASLDGSGIETVGLSSGGIIRGIAFDSITQGIFATNDLAGASSQVIGPDTQIINASSASGLAIDAVGRSVYWAGDDGVRRAAIGAMQSEQVIAAAGYFGPIAYTAIPEPSSAALATAALLLIVALRVSVCARPRPLR
jgi:hypothetical protein